MDTLRFVKRPSGHVRSELACRRIRHALATRGCLVGLLAAALVPLPFVHAQAADQAVDDPEPDTAEVQIMQALDQPVDLKLEDAPIRRAFEQLSDNTGIAIKLAQGTTAFLPYGSDTKLSAEIQKRPLREGLMALLRPLGLKFEVTKDTLLVGPTPPLQRLGRRATWPELDLLNKLYSQPWSDELFKSLDLQFQDSKLPAGADGRAMMGDAAKNVGAGSAAEILDVACDKQNWTWYPQGETVVILSKAQQIDKQLEARVTLRYVQINLGEALMDLAKRAHVLMRMDPGVLQSLPPQALERFSLSIENATIRQVLEVISGETGLQFEVRPDGVRVTQARGGSPASAAADPNASMQAAAATLRSNPIIGQFNYPLPDGSSFGFFVRQNDLPPEVEQLRQKKVGAGIAQMRRQLAAEQPQD